MKLPYTINKTQEAATVLLLSAAAIASFFLYPKFPEQVATHWNYAGEADGYSGRAFAAFFFPMLAIGIYLLMTFLPLADPRRERYADFSGAYNVLRLSITILMVALYGIMSLNGLGFVVPVGLIMPVAVGLLFVIIGNFLPKVKRNWFVGIRTPWTLSSEEVWNKTHRMGGKLFVLGGFLMVLMVFAHQATLWWVVFMAIIGMMVIGTIGYSWFLWRNKH